MSIWNKILIGLIFVTSVAFFYMGARTLATHNYWRSLARAMDEKVEKLEKENKELVEGPEEGDEDAVDEDGQPELGIKGLRLELYKSLLDRGRVWYNCTREQVGQAGLVTVKTDLPDPHLIRPKTTLFLFEEKDLADKDAPDNGKYLGEFIVTSVNERQVEMRPARKLSAEEENLLAASVGTWRMYDIMPIDVRSVFSKLDDDEKKKILPTDTVIEYIKDGTPAERDDPKDRIFLCKNGRPVDPDKPEDLEGAEQLYVRLLRDYKILFESYHRRKVILADKKAVNETDCYYVQNTLADAKQQRTFRQAEVAERQRELARIGRESTAIRQYGSNLSARIGQLQVAIATLAKQNRAAAARIAQIQAKAAQAINARTRAMAQSSGSGG